MTFDARASMLETNLEAACIKVVREWLVWSRGRQIQHLHESAAAVTACSRSEVIFQAVMLRTVAANTQRCTLDPP